MTSMPAVALRERDPAAESERRRRRPAADGDVQVVARDVDLQHAILEVALLVERCQHRLISAGMSCARTVAVDGPTSARKTSVRYLVSRMAFSRCKVIPKNDFMLRSVFPRGAPVIVTRTASRPSAGHDRRCWIR